MTDYQGPRRFEGRTVIVTGGSSGYGLGTVERFALEGATVYATARGRERLEAAVGQWPSVAAVAADVRAAEDWQRVVAMAVEQTGKVDILVNNAGAGIRIAPLEEHSVEDIETSLAINLTGAIVGCRAVVPLMKKAGRGTIVNVLSLCARNAWPGFSVYSAAKAGLEQFTRCLHVELREHGVRVTSLIPAWGKTAFLAASGRPPFRPEIAERVTQPEQFGAVVADLCALPDNLTMLDATLLPLVQEIEPL